MLTSYDFVYKTKVLHYKKDWLITLPAFVEFFQFYIANNPQGILGTPFHDDPTVYNQECEYEFEIDCCCARNANHYEYLSCDIW